MPGQKPQSEVVFDKQHLLHPQEHQGALAWHREQSAYLESGYLVSVARLLVYM